MTQGVEARSLKLLYDNKSISPKQGGPVSLYFSQDVPRNEKDHFLIAEKPGINPESKGDDNSQYFIQEKDICSAVSEKHKKKYLKDIDPLVAPSEESLTAFQGLISAHREDSYARVRMANNRAIKRLERHRKDYIENSFNEQILSCLEGGKPGLKIEIPTYLLSEEKATKLTTDYTEFLFLTVKRECSLPLKNLFKILQVYPTVKRNIGKDGKSKLVPTVIYLENIGGIAGQFMISPWPSGNYAEDSQVLVSTLSSQQDKFIGRTYEQLIEAMTKDFKEEQDKCKQLAGAIIECLNLPTNAQSSVLSNMNLTEAQKNAVVEFIALTQIAESAYSTIITSSFNGVRGLAISPSSRTPGMDKLARKIIREISEGKIGWSDAFRPVSAQCVPYYPPAGTNGASRARHCTITSQRPRGPSGLPAATAFNMSDDSEEE